jgi:hypothetical protein
VLFGEIVKDPVESNKESAMILTQVASTSISRGASSRMPENPCSMLPYADDGLDAQVIQNSFEHTLKALDKSGGSCCIRP